MAHCRDAHAVSGADQIEDHSRAGEGLSRPGRPLNRQDTMVEFTGETHGRVHQSSPGKRRAPVGSPVRRGARFERRSRAAWKGPRRVDALISSPATERQQRVVKWMRIHSLVGDDRRWVDVHCVAPPLLDIEPASGVVHSLYRPECVPTRLMKSIAVPQPHLWARKR